MQLKRLVFLIIGCVSLGCVGIVLPVLPTVPFFLLTVFCFSPELAKAPRLVCAYRALPQAPGILRPEEEHARPH